MWTKFVKSFRLVVSLAVMLLPLPFANACGVSYYGEDYRVALLNPYVIGDEWSAYFYSAERFNHTRHEQNGSDRQRNCADWANHLGQGVTANEVKALVYDASYDELLNAIAEGADNQRFGANTFFHFLLKKENKAVLDYLLLAKEYEYFSFLENSDPWSESWDNWEETQSAVEKGKKQVEQKMAANYKQEKDPYLRRRYAYQLLVMSVYANDTKRFEQLYAEHFKDGNNALRDWATYHRAAIVADTVEANYLLAMSFLRCPEKRIACYQRFDKSLKDKTLAFCKNDAERAAVVGLAALRNPGRALSDIKKLASLDPKCPLLPLLLVREISKLEDWLLTDELTGMGTASYPDQDDEAMWEWDDQQWEAFRLANKEKDKNYLTEVKDFIVGLASQKSGALSNDISNLFAGHLALMQKQGGTASKYLEVISPKANPRIAEQQLTEQVLLLLNSADIGSASTKDKLAELLNRLKNVKKDHQNGSRDFAALNLLLSRDYMQRGDLLTAYFFNNHALELPTDQRYDYGTAYYELIRFLDWRASEQDIDILLALMEKKDKTPFERYLINAPLPSRNALLDLRGTISFRKNDLKAAISSFEKVAPDFWKTKYEFADHLVSDPFVMATDSLRRGVFPDNKKVFAQRLLELENEAKAQPALAAKNYLLLGTAWLNCTYHGKSWMMFSYGNSINENANETWANYSYCPPTATMKDIYYGCKRAFDYLEKAKSATKDREIHAKVDYLIARQRSWSYELTPAEQAEVDAMEWDKTGKFYMDKEMGFFKDWVSTYKSTSYYKEATSACPVLVTYFGK